MAAGPASRAGMAQPICCWTPRGRWAAVGGHRETRPGDADTRRGDADTRRGDTDTGCAELNLAQRSHGPESAAATVTKHDELMRRHARHAAGRRRCAMFAVLAITTRATAIAARSAPLGALASPVAGFCGGLLRGPRSQTEAGGGRLVRWRELEARARLPSLSQQGSADRWRGACCVALAGWAWMHRGRTWERTFACSLSSSREYMRPNGLGTNLRYQPGRALGHHEQS